MMKYLLNAWNKTNRWHRVIFVVVVLQVGGLPQRKPGYYCNDPSLSYAYTGDTISWKLLLLATLVVPLIFIYSVEALCNICKGSKEFVLHSTKNNVWRVYVEYAYGLLLDLALVQIIKVLVGEPRPHFFDVCKPDTPCEGSEFVSSYKCTNDLYSDIRKADAGRSFPSGHTSISVHAAVFMAWYLHKKTSENLQSFSFYMVPVIQTLLVLSGALCGISRITDRRHHWWDVLAGAIVGLGILLYTILYKCKNIHCFNTHHTTITIKNGSNEKLSVQDDIQHFKKNGNSSVATEPPSHKNN